MCLTKAVTSYVAAFSAAVKHYQNQRWILKWGSIVVERYDPPD